MSGPDDRSMHICDVLVFPVSTTGHRLPQIYQWVEVIKFCTAGMTGEQIKLPFRPNFQSNYLLDSNAGF
jgi:hypothetical protein